MLSIKNNKKRSIAFMFILYLLQLFSNIKYGNFFLRLKVENSKLIFQNAYTEISLAKADNFAKSEKVKLFQSVINLLTLGYSNKNNRYSNKNNQSDSYVKTGGEKNDESECSSTLPVIANDILDNTSEVKIQIV